MNGLCFLDPYLLMTIMMMVMTVTSVPTNSIVGLQENKNENLWNQLMELENCSPPERVPKAIINVNGSLEAGGLYLANPGVKSFHECELECCKASKDNCNIAVYQESQMHCYLFNCGSPSKCLFEPHDGYAVSVVNSAVISEERTTLKLTSALMTTTVLPPKNVDLLGGCRVGIDTCTDINADCSQNAVCLCEAGYHPKNRVCRMDCDALQFECTNGDAKFGSPDCIAIYDVCDGTPQCPDGSDEIGCKPADPLSWLKGHVPTTESSERMKPHLAEQFPLPWTSTSKVPAIDVNAFVNSVQRQGLPVTSLVEQLATSTSSDILQHVPNDQAADKANVTQQHDDTAKRADLDKLHEAQTSNSAIIALSLSLVFTFLLIVYFGIRYRNMRTRLLRNYKAKGNEADYLIDGMYL